MRKVYRGRDIEVSFDLDICIHIAECLRGHPGVFNLERRPWVLPDEAEADVVAEIVERCPSEWKRFVLVWGRRPADLALQKAVKCALDPQNMFNPGRFVTDAHWDLRSARET